MYMFNVILWLQEIATSYTPTHKDNHGPRCNEASFGNTYPKEIKVTRWVSISRGAAETSSHAELAVVQPV